MAIATSSIHQYRGRVSSRPDEENRVRRVERIADAAAERRDHDGGGDRAADIASEAHEDGGDDRAHGASMPLSHRR